MGKIIVFALLSAVYPTLIAATTVMLLLPKAESLMFGFWLGAMITSVTCGVVIVFAFGDSSVTSARHTTSPAVDLGFAALLVLAALALARGEDQRLREKHTAKHPREHKKTPAWRRRLEDGNPRHSFAAAIILSFPGVWYLAALDQMIKLNYSTVVVIVVVVGFCLAQLLLIEVPMVAFKIWPEQTPMAIDRAKAWAGAHGRRYGVSGLLIVAGLLVIRAAIGFLS